jgi:hypothetical protein
MAAHAHFVALHVTTTDPMSPGWTSFGGWGFILSMAHTSGALMIVPMWGAAILLPLALLGWVAPATSLTDRVSLTLLAWIPLFMMVGRPDNFYWGLLLAPLLPAGLAFAPAALIDLGRAAFPRRITATA